MGGNGLKDENQVAFTLSFLHNKMCRKILAIITRLLSENGVKIIYAVALYHLNCNEIVHKLIYIADQLFNKNLVLKRN